MKLKEFFNKLIGRESPSKECINEYSKYNFAKLINPNISNKENKNGGIDK